MANDSLGPYKLYNAIPKRGSLEVETGRLNAYALSDTVITSTYYHLSISDVLHELE